MGARESDGMPDDPYTYNPGNPLDPPRRSPNIESGGNLLDLVREAELNRMRYGRAGYAPGGSGGGGLPGESIWNKLKRWFTPEKSAPTAATTTTTGGTAATTGGGSSAAKLAMQFAGGGGGGGGGSQPGFVAPQSSDLLGRAQAMAGDSYDYSTPDIPSTPGEGNAVQYQVALPPNPVEIQGQGRSGLATQLASQPPSLSQSGSDLVAPLIAQRRQQLAQRLAGGTSSVGLG